MYVRVIPMNQGSDCCKHSASSSFFYSFFCTMSNRLNILNTVILNIYSCEHSSHSHLLFKLVWSCVTHTCNQSVTPLKPILMMSSNCKKPGIQIFIQWLVLGNTFPPVVARGAAYRSRGLCDWGFTRISLQCKNKTSKSPTINPASVTLTFKL